MSTNKLVSVYIPSHERSSMAIRAIESVLNQTYSPIEIVLCNDGSRDVGYEKVEKLLLENGGQYLRNDEPQGACFSRNRAIEQANGFYITGLDDDDEFTPERIANMMGAYTPDTAFIATTYMEISKTSKTARTFNTGVISHQLLLHYNAVGNQIFTETEKLKAAGNFDTELPAMQDYELWIRMTKRYGNGLKINKPSYLVHTEHESERISGNHEKLATSIKRVQEKHTESLSKEHYNTHAFLLAREQLTRIPVIQLLKFLNATNFRLIAATFLKQRGLRT